MSNFAIMRTAKVKSVASMANLEKHCSREKMPTNADKSRTNQNMDFAQDKLTLPERFAKLTEGQKIRKNAVLGFEVMMTYTPDSLRDSKTLLKWVDDNRKWLQQEFGQKNVVRLWLHMDESTPHLHAFVVPIDERGKLNCRAYLGGADKLSALQDSYAEAMKPYSLERGIKGSKAHHKTVKEFYRAVEQAERQNLPQYTKKTEKGLFGAEKTVTEPIENYYERANAAFKQQGLQLVGLQEQLRKEKEKNRTKSVREELARAEEKRELRELRTKASEAGRYKAKATAWDRLNKGLNGLDDKNHAQDLKVELQGILDKQESMEKSMEQMRPAPMPEMEF